MYKASINHVMSPPTFGCGACGMPEKSCQCLKHDEKNDTKPHQDIPGTLSHIFTDFTDRGRFALMQIENTLSQLAGTMTMLNGHGQNNTAAPSGPGFGDNDGM